MNKRVCVCVCTYMCVCVYVYVCVFMYIFESGFLLSFHMLAAKTVVRGK